MPTAATAPRATRHRHGAARGPGSDLRLAPSACRRRRKALGLSTYALAQRAGLDEQTVLRFEAALARPRHVTVVALRNALSRLERAASAPEPDRQDAP